MNRFAFCLKAALIAALSTAVLVGCGGLREDDDGGPSRKGPRPSGDGGAKAAELKPVKAKSYGVIKGEVAWTGGDVKPAPLSFVGTDKDYCAKGADEYETSDASIWVGDNKKLGNVFVWIEPEADHFFEVPEDQLKGYKGAKVTIGQPRCAFLPHCAVLFPVHYKDGKRVPTGQDLIILNDAKVTHNANIDNTGKPGAIPQGGEEKATSTLSVGKKALTVVCNIHPWMKGHLRAFDHPYAALTRVGENLEKKVYQDRKDANFGTYEIKGVPVGATVTLHAWHESLGPLGSRKITLKPEQTENFTAAPK